MEGGQKNNIKDERDICGSCSECGGEWGKDEMSKYYLHFIDGVKIGQFDAVCELCIETLYEELHLRLKYRNDNITAELCCKRLRIPKEIFKVNWQNSVKRAADNYYYAMKHLLQFEDTSELELKKEK